LREIRGLAVPFRHWPPIIEARSLAALRLSTAERLAVWSRTLWCVLTCTTCGQESPDGFRFCGSCGAPLTEPRPRREERKVVTVLFADIVGFTARAERLDPEDVRALLSPLVGSTSVASYLFDVVSP
jgi:class 3 adenylate cyclase